MASGDLEGLTFANFRPDQDGIESIYAIGAGDGSNKGVIEEVAVSFDHTLADEPSVDNLGELIGKVGPAKELQQNIGLVQEALGTDKDAVTLTRGWAERSGLLIPVERSYMTGNKIDGPIDLAIVTGGVRNWMVRRTNLLNRLYNSGSQVGAAVLVGGNRVMKTSEGPDVAEGMTEAEYMRQFIIRKIEADGRGMSVTAVRVETDKGDQVMQAGAEYINGELVDLASARIVVVSNAGAWAQNAGQFRRAIRAVVSPDFDSDGSQLFVASDEFPLGTGVEPTATHQNPFSAVGQIVRNAQELARHTA